MKKITQILLAVISIVFIIFGVMLYFGYASILRQMYFSRNNPSNIALMWSFNKTSIKGSYAFQRDGSFYFWTLDGLHKISMKRISRITYYDACSRDVVALMKQSSYFETKQWLEGFLTGITSLDKFKSGSPVVIQPNANREIEVSIYNYYPQLLDMGVDVCQL